MRQHRFHSELTCDEVWYRLNVLLQDFAVCGARRYEVRGELTEWGCRLWLQDPEGLHRTPVPLRLWTEESVSPGCDIVCSFLPGWRDGRELLVSGGGLCLVAFLMELVGGVSFFLALVTGFWVGCFSASVLYLLSFGVPYLLSRRREAELLEWIQKYLLLRDLEGVLLPDPETQRAEWMGLPQAERPMERRRFVFHCALPPEDIPASVETWISQQRSSEAGVRVKWSAEWRGTKLKLSRTEIEEGQREPGSLKIFAGWFKTWQFANPFCGTLEPDGRGGSILRGAFRHPPESFLPLLLGLLGACCCLWQGYPRVLLPLFAGTAFAARWMGRAPLRNPGSREILQFLRTYFEEV